MALLEAGEWWAVVAEQHRDDERSYWRVIAWETVADSEENGGASQLVAWINGRQPVRSDRFYKQVEGWVLYGFVDSLPENASSSSWS